MSTTTLSKLTRYTLNRVPHDPQLQAYNAADELMLSRLDEHWCADSRLLLVNDTFGALAVALADARPDWWQDSAMARSALDMNCHRNQCARPGLITTPEDLAPEYDHILLQAPKSLPYFDWQLSQLAPRLIPDGTLWVLGMVKHLSRGHQQIMARHFAAQNPGRAVKKARCVALQHPREDQQPASPEHYETPDGLHLINHPGVFSDRRPDPGALAFLQYFDRLPVRTTALDLGCGNGILGLTYAARVPAAQVTLVDEHFRAIQSARDSARANQLDDRIRVEHNDGLQGLTLEPMPLILCNPPFHQNTTVTDSLADQLFADAARFLSPDGEFWMVGNRHLNYHRRLKRWFRDVSVQSSHPKFVVLQCRGPRHPV